MHTLANLIWDGALLFLFVFVCCCRYQVPEEDGIGVSGPDEPGFVDKFGAKTEDGTVVWMDQGKVGTGE
jgi:hypothetical protein